MLNANLKLSYGSDPEAFFRKDGQIIGSEKLIPENGIRAFAGKIVRDGVQFELNPTSATNISDLGRCISRLFHLVQDRVDKQPGVDICFDGLVEVSREELDSLSPGCRVLGCTPSYNVYEERPIDVDPIEYRKRSSGGHVHIGTRDNEVMANRRGMVPVLDVLVGNTAVLFDRDPGAAERRENYGRAGECRFPDHGLEYRTPSNFWLRDYSLMQLTFGMAAAGYALMYQSLHGDKTPWNSLTRCVKIEDVVKAIDTNDFKLAMRNFKKIVPFIRKHFPKQGFPLNAKNIDAFIGCAETVEKKGIEHFFPTQQIVANWIRGEQVEFEAFLQP